MLTDNQRYSLIYEVVSTYVYQVLKAIFEPVDERIRLLDNRPDWDWLVGELVRTDYRHSRARLH